MNERMIELANKANETVGHTFRLEDAKQLHELMEKFAELIVKQCGYYADIFESIGYPVDMDPTETKPSDYIKKHFGVE